MAKILFFDLETTGLDYKENAIIQLAGIIVNIDEFNKITVLDKFCFNMRPRMEHKIDMNALIVNHFNMNTIMSFQDDHEVFIEFNKILERHCDKSKTTEKYILAGYNSLHFDQDFLKRWFELNNDKSFFQWFWSNGIDVMSEAGRYLIHYRPAMQNFKLATVADILEVLTANPNNLHNALLDIAITIRVFMKIFNAPTKVLAWDPDLAEKMFMKMLTKRRNNEKI